ncbi:MAG: hypothetical protein WA154_14970 [Moraxellaceae bacterium]
MNTAYQTAATSCSMPLVDGLLSEPTNPVYLSTTVALSWGAFLLDGLLESHIAPYTRRAEVMSHWSQPFDQLIEHNNQVLWVLAERVKHYWQHPLMLKPALFESLVVNGIGDYIARYLIEYDGVYPPPAAYCAQIDMYLGLFFPDFKAPTAQSYVVAQQHSQATHSAQGVHS